MAQIIVLTVQPEKGKVRLQASWSDGIAPDGVIFALEEAARTLKAQRRKDGPGLTVPKIVLPGDLK